VSKTNRVKGILWTLGIIGVVYIAVSYFVLPFIWDHYEHHKKMQGAPKTTFTAQGIPGDPLNVALVGEEADIVDAVVSSGWTPADPETFKSSARIVESVILNKPYPNAPVSDLFLWNRREDLAFEKPVGSSAKERHHVRFWKSQELSEDGLLWVGAATFDRSVGLSHTTGQITHHVASDIDTERDKLIEDLKGAGRLDKIYQVTGVGPAFFGKNAGGDTYFTDGELTVGVVIKGGSLRAEPPALLANPARVQWKQAVWNWILGLRKGYTRK